MIVASLSPNKQNNAYTYKTIGQAKADHSRMNSLKEAELKRYIRCVGVQPLIAKGVGAEGLGLRRPRKKVLTQLKV